MGTKDRLNQFVALRLPTALMKDLEALCKQQQKTTSALIREAIANRIRTSKTPSD